MTVNELLEELQNHADHGRGNLPVLDEGDNEITSIEYNTDMYPAIVMLT
jgi:hypothetical protein